MTHSTVPNSQLPSGPSRHEVENGTVRLKPARVQITFVIDTTGSMSDKIDALIDTCVGFVTEPAKFNLDPTYSLVSFGDLTVPGDRIELVVYPTNDIEKIKYGLMHIPRNGGGGNEGESSLEAVAEAMKIQVTPGVIKVIILITDEPALQRTVKAANTIAALTQANYLVYTVATGDQYYKDMATRNGGEWREISANSRLDHIKEMFRNLAPKVAAMIKNVKTLGKGDVQETIRLLASGTPAKK